MKFIFISDNGKHHYKLNINKWALIALAIVMLVLMTVLLLNPKLFNRNALSQGETEIIERFDSYLKRLATLEAQIQRLNALGARIAEKNNINIDSFSLEKAPARGGMLEKNDHDMAIIKEQDLLDSIKQIENILTEKEKIFNLYQDLNTVQTNNKLLKKHQEYYSNFLYNSPVNKGYISSKYGYRRDPINGKHRYHRGIDIAANTGTLVSTITSGFVSFTGWKGGYGKVVEIQHSNSLKSRYAHLSVISVKKGQVVRKGDAIGKIGSTGRVTGPHLHLEVWKNGKAVNPKGYLEDALENLQR